MIKSFSCCLDKNNDKELFLDRRAAVKPVLSSHSKRIPKIGFQCLLSLNAGQKYCRMLQGEHSAILSTFIKLPFSIKTIVLSNFFKWLLKTGFTLSFSQNACCGYTLVVC